MVKLTRPGVAVDRMDRIRTGYFSGILSYFHPVNSLMKSILDRMDRIFQSYCTYARAHGKNKFKTSCPCCPVSRLSKEITGRNTDRILFGHPVHILSSQAEAVIVKEG
jgi:hypothetical protein